MPVLVRTAAHSRQAQPSSSAASATQKRGDEAASMTISHVVEIRHWNAAQTNSAESTPDPDYGLIRIPLVRRGNLDQITTTQTNQTRTLLKVRSIAVILGGAFAEAVSQSPSRFARWIGR